MWDGPPEYARTIFRSLATYTTGSLGKGEIPVSFGWLRMMRMLFVCGDGGSMQARILN